METSCQKNVKVLRFFLQKYEIFSPDFEIWIFMKNFKVFNESVMKNYQFSMKVL